ncbi:MAG: SMC-Scp complex subunit ScpB [Gammaproteobacteria bacterium]|nr:SMC-Scp complex subunit ScpB [Gammaproteobacteria bacterium]
MELKKLKQIIEAALMASGGALKLDNIESLFEGDEDMPSRDDVLKALHGLMEDCAERGIELKEISSGFRYQARQELSPWVQRLWEEKPQRYSRALLETLALVAYRQPITRSEIEEVRGVSVSSTIMKTLQEREWVRVVGHRDVPGKPAMYATTKGFLDYFSLQSLDELPTLSEIRDIDNINVEMAFGDGEEGESDKPDITPESETDTTDLPESAQTDEHESSTGGDETEAVTTDVVTAELQTEPEEEPMQGLSDEEMKAIDVLNKSFRENLHGPAVAEEDIEPEADLDELAGQTMDEVATEIGNDELDDTAPDAEAGQKLEQEN